MASFAIHGGAPCAPFSICPCLRLHGIVPSEHGTERPDLLAADLQSVLVCLAAARDHLQPEEEGERLVGDFARRVRQRRA